MSASAVLAKIFTRSVCIYRRAKQSHGTIHFGQVTRAKRPFLIARSATSVTAADWRNEKRNEKGTETNRVRNGQVPDRGDKDHGGPTAGTRTAGTKHLIVAAVASWAMSLRSLGYVPAISFWAMSLRSLSLLNSVLARAKHRCNARFIPDAGVFHPRPKDCGSLFAQ